MTCDFFATICVLMNPYCHNRCMSPSKKFLTHFDTPDFVNSLLSIIWQFPIKEFSFCFIYIFFLVILQVLIFYFICQLYFYSLAFYIQMLQIRSQNYFPPSILITLWMNFLVFCAEPCIFHLQLCIKPLYYWI